MRTWSSSAGSRPKGGEALAEAMLHLLEGHEGILG
jgi:hypothetical protein